MDVVLLGEVEELVNGVNSNISAVKSVVDTINSNTSSIGTINTNVSAIKTNTAANSTESSTGTLSQKLAYLINRRDRIITPSSTNIKTLSTSLSASLAASEKTYVNEKETNTVYSGSSSTVYAKQSGVYRFYFSGTLKQTSYATDDEYKDKCSMVGYVYVYHIGSGNTTTHTVTIISNLAAVYSKNQTATLATSTATKTIDVPMQKGDRVYCKIALVNTSAMRPVYGETYCWWSDWSASCTDCSIRGTVQELNSITT